MIILTAMGSLGIKPFDLPATNHERSDSADSFLSHKNQKDNS